MKNKILFAKSGYSFFDSTLKINDIICIAKENEVGSIALIDNSNLFGAMEFYKSCLKEGIKPIIGMQINYLENNGKTYPLILIAKDVYGYKTLCKLTEVVSKGSLNVCIDKEDLVNYKSGISLIMPISKSYLKVIDEDQFAD